MERHRDLGSALPWWGQEPNQELDPSDPEAARAVHTPGSCFLGLLCSRGSQTCLQPLGCRDCLSHFPGAGGVGALADPGSRWCRAWEISLPSPLSSSPLRLLLTFGLICMWWVGGSDGSS